MNTYSSRPGRGERLEGERDLHACNNLVTRYSSGLMRGKPPLAKL